MGKPKIKWQKKDKSFINPYTFLPLIDKCKRDTFNIEKSKFTGFLECEIKTETPLFIPNTTNDKAFLKYTKTASETDFKLYDFFSYNDISNKNDCDNDPEPKLPVIPGSEIRGVLRSVYEAITNSCMSTVDVNKKLNKRTAAVGKPGIIGKDKNGWYLVDAIRYQINRNATYKEGQKVFFIKKGFRIKKHSIKEGDFYNFGYFHKSSESLTQDKGNKKYESVFVPKGGTKKYLSNEAKETLVNRLNQLIDIYKQIEDTDYKNYDKKDKLFLIYYAIHNVNGNEVFYVSPAAMSQEVFQNNLAQILKNQGEFQPCESTDCICPACSLFGMVSPNNSIASRVRITDAKLIDKDTEINKLYYAPAVLEELSSPKLQATEFYLLGKSRYGKLDIWNYDYAGNGQRKYYNDKQDYIPLIKGRKFYWHNKNWMKNVHFDNINEHIGERNVCVRLLREETIFKFTIYTDGISKNELQNLIWSVNLGNNDDLQCHKLGMGKPLGLGSVKMRVISVNERKISLTPEETIIRKVLPLDIDVNSIGPICYDETTKNRLLKITDFNNSFANIQYPFAEDKIDDGENGSGGHQWFIANREDGITYELPHIDDQKQSMLEFIKY